MVDFDKDRDANLSAFERTGGAANGGLTVRDYFAAKVMQSMANVFGPMNTAEVVALAEDSYFIADAMMKEREKPVRKPTPTVEEAFGLNK